MKILALDTATEACSAALWWDGEIVERYRVAPRQHNELILPMIDEVLVEGGIRLDQLDALAFGRGPGSFTGVRIAAGVVQGIGLAAELPVIPISTLAALAFQALHDCPGARWALPSIDARMQEVYCAVYVPDEQFGVLLVQSEYVLAPTLAAQLAFPDGIGAGVGSAWLTYRDILHAAAGGRISVLASNHFPRAYFVADLAARQWLRGRAVLAREALPTYVRDRVTQVRTVENAGSIDLPDPP